MTSGRVIFDLQATQSRSYADRGVARYTLELARELARGHPDLVGQFVLNPRLTVDDDLIARLDGLPWTTSPSWQGTGGIWFCASPFELDTPVEELWPRQSSLQGMRLVACVYDLIPEVFPEIYLRDAGLRRRYRARKELVRFADHIVTLSRSTALDVKSRLGLPEERVTVVGAAPGGGFKPPLDKGEALRVARSSVDGLGDRFVVYNGAIEPRKNVERLLEAFALLPSRLRDSLQLVLVCGLRPLERNHLEVRAGQLGIRLVLTGYVSDDVLVAIYQAAELAVFPSLYEGFGLPVAEALACGAPVIASATSSLVELIAPDAGFDPTDSAAISAVMRAALEDHDGLRSRLLDWARRPQTAWADVAHSFAAVCERLGDVPGYKRRRPRLALVTPWPPARSGVAAYSERLVGALAPHVEVDVFADGDVRSPSVPRAPVDLPLVERAAGGYDARILMVGNSEHHAGALRLLRSGRSKAVACLHDVRLVNLYLHGAARGAVEEGFRAAVARLCPEIPAELTEGDRLSDDDAVRHGVFMASEVVGLAELVLVTSQSAAQIATAASDPGDAGKVRIWPFAYPPANPRPPGGVDPSLVCSFGVVDPLKCPDVLVQALAQLRVRRPEARLAFVGPVAAELAEELHAQAEALGLDGSVVITGRIDDADYDRWLCRAAVAVQLRRHSNGEASAAVADCLARGVPVVVSDCGPQSELPDFVTKVPVPPAGDDVAHALETLLADSDHRESISRDGFAFVSEHGFERAASDLIQLLPALRGFEIPA